MKPLAVLERFVRTPAPGIVDPGDRCGLCGMEVEHRHARVVDIERHTIACACRACYVLMSHPGAVHGCYRALPERVLVDPAFTLSDPQWAALQIPVGLAFIGLDGAGRWTAHYPGAAGAARAAVPAEAWAEVASAPLVQAVAPDVEALLVFGRPGVVGRETFLVPIDRCYALVGLVRKEWRGLSGGCPLWQAVDAFFADLRGKARPLIPQEGAA